MSTTCILIDCPERIACDVCAQVCKNAVIRVSPHIHSRPIVKSARECTSCASCVAHCPGHAVFLLDEEYSASECSIALPWEMPDIPEVGEMVELVENHGEKRGFGTVIDVKCPKSFDKICVIFVRTFKSAARKVRGARRVDRGK